MKQQSNIATAQPTAGSWPIGVDAISVWAVARVPLLLAVLYWQRHTILSWIEQHFDIVFVTTLTIDVLSTPVSRVLYTLVLATALVATLAVGRARFPRFAPGVTLAVAAVIIGGSFYITGTQRRLAAWPLLVLTTNLAFRFSTRARHYARFRNAFMTFAVGVAEIATVREYLQWLGERNRAGMRDRVARSGIWLDAVAVLLASTIAAMLLQRYSLVAVEQAVRMSNDAQIIDIGDFNWIALDNTEQYLYATGHGLPHLRRYHIGDWSRPLHSVVETGGAQTFAYDPVRREIYTFNLRTKQLLSLDAETLDMKRQLLLQDLAPGDPWITIDETSDTIAIASEADDRVGSAFVLLNRTTGAILDQRDLDPGNLLQHPAKPLLYMSFFRRASRLLAYDLRHRTVVLDAASDPRVDRMAFWQAGNELLVASPTEARVIRYDADTLVPLGTIETVFGVRVIAVDERRALLLCGSLTTGVITIHDLNSRRELSRHYLGPWLRTIAVNSPAGTAYVSSRGALFSLRYAATSRDGPSAHSYAAPGDGAPGEVGATTAVH